MLPNTKQSLGLSIADGIVLDKEQLSSSLSAFKKTCRSELALESLKDTEVLQRSIRQISERIIEVLKKGNDLSLKELKGQLIEVSNVGEYQIFDGRSFTGQTQETLLGLGDKPEYWNRRVLGGIRENLFPLDSLNNVKQALDFMLRTPESLTNITGPDGYRRVAQLFCGGAMQKAYQLMSAVTKVEGVNFDDLKWGNRFHGSTEEFASLL